MIHKIENAGLMLRIVLLSFFIIASVVLAILCAIDAHDKPKVINGSLAFWPPDIVPHPPHFPDPKPRKPPGPDVC